MVQRLAAFASADRMGVVEANQPFARRPVKRERVVKAVRLFRRGRNARDDKLHPMTAFGIDDEYLAVEIEKRVETWIAIPLIGLVIIRR